MKAKVRRKKEKVKAANGDGGFEIISDFKSVI